MPPMLGEYITSPIVDAGGLTLNVMSTKANRKAERKKKTAKKIKKWEKTWETAAC